MAPLILPPVVEFPTEKIFPNPANKRTDYDLASLLPSVLAHGILQPLGGWRDGHGCAWLIWGHRRFMVAKELKLPTVPIRLWQQEPPAAQRALLRTLENCQRADLKPSELAAEFEELIETHDLTARELAQHLGGRYSEPTISRYRELLVQPPDVIAQVDGGVLGLTPALLVGRFPDAEERRELLRQLREGLTSREKIERLAHERFGKKRHVAAKHVKLTATINGAHATFSNGAEWTPEALEAFAKELLKKARAARGKGGDDFRNFIMKGE